MASVDSEYANQQAISCETLRKAQFITLAKSISFEQALQSLSESLGFTPSVIIMCEDPFYVIKFVEARMGIAYVPSKSWKNRFSSNVVLRPVEGHSYQRQNYLYRNSKYPYSDASKLFIKELAAMASNL